MATMEEEKLPNKFNFGIWIKIGKYALREWKLLLIIVLAMLFTTFYDSAFVPVFKGGAIKAVSSFATSALSGNVWDTMIHLTWIKGLLECDIPFYLFCILEGVAILFRSFSIYLTFYYTNILSLTIMENLRSDCFKKIQELSFSYFDKTNSGWLIARMNNDTSSIGDVLSWDAVSMGWAFFDFIFTLITMMSQDYKLGLIVLSSIPLMAIVIPLIQRELLKRWRVARNAYSHFVGWLAEAISGAKTIKSMAIEKEVEEEAKVITDEIKEKRFKAGKVHAFFQPIVSMVSNLMIALIVYIGVKMALEGNAEALDTATLIATIVLFVGFVSSIYSPLESLSEVFNDFISAQAGAEKVGQILDEVPEIRDKKEVIEKYGTLFEPKEENYEPMKGQIDFLNVTFAYSNGIEVIHPLTLHIKEGESVAIVGETGSGKTTMVNLLCRFYEPSSGKIEIDGVDYLDRSLGYLRSNIGYVQQSPFVFSGTYFDNIRYGKLDATLEEVKRVSKIVGIDEFIEKQEKGYDTFLEDGGSSLSQGQKQLISFARALIRDPRILILDEATSSIDTETESLIQESLLKLLKGRTSFTIAHRLSTIVHCDRILVMSGGNIEEDGNHESLMRKKGAYYRLYMNQFNDMSIEEQERIYSEQIEKKNIDL